MKVAISNVTLHPVSAAQPLNCRSQSPRLNVLKNFLE